jgi:putative ABC transport system permease protein
MLSERISALWLRLKALVRRRELDRDLDDELQFHLAMREQKLREQGVAAEEAHYAARRQFGNVTRLKETSRELWGFQWLETLLQDLRYGLRQLKRNPGFTAVVVLTLALGIGGNTAMFSVIDAVLLRPLPYKDSHQLVSISSSNSILSKNPISPLAFSEIKHQTNVFQDLALHSAWGAKLTGPGDPERAYRDEISPDFFRLLNVRPILGRAFLAEEAQPGRNHVALISEPDWKNRFGGDPHVLGRAVYLDDTAYTIVGVLPSSFKMPYDFWSARRLPTIWVPFRPISEGSPRYREHRCEVIGRLSTGVDLTQAQSQVHAVAQRLAQAFPEENKGWDLQVDRIEDEVVSGARSALLILFGAVGFVLLIACVNIANLVLARGAGREKEIAIRESVGASRLRVIRQLLIESILLSLLGGLLGLVGALWGVRGLLAIAPQDIPRLGEVHIDLAVITFAFVASTIVGLIFGALPAISLSKVDLNTALKEGGATSHSGFGSIRRRRARSLLVVSETALATVLLVGAGLLIRSFWKLTTVDPGFQTGNLLVLSVTPTAKKFDNPQQLVTFFNDALARVRMLPGVREACVTGIAPIIGGGAVFFNPSSVEGQPSGSSSQPIIMEYQPVSPGYFRTLGQRLMAGRDFDDHDNAGAPGVIIINEAFARRYLSNQNPLGKHILAPWISEQSRLEIVGVVSNVRDAYLNLAPQPEIFVPYMQDPRTGMFIVVRTTGQPLKLAPAVRDIIWSVDKDRPILDITTVEENLSDSVAGPRFRVVLLGAFAGLALVLALVGIYGVVSYGVTQQTHEFGVRMALGASQHDVLKQVVGQGLMMAMSGAVLGLAAALALSRVLTSMLYELRPTDPATFVSAAILLTCVSLVACYIPARRATKVDPMVALRYE